MGSFPAYQPRRVSPLCALLRAGCSYQDDVFDPAQPDQDLITDYGYDAQGRVVTTTVGVGSALAHSEVTVYNADDTIACSIQNYQDGVFDPAQPDQGLITEYGYDGVGRHIWLRDVLGRECDLL